MSGRGRWARLRVAIALAATLAVAAVARAQTVSATVDRTEVTTEDQLVLTVTVEGGGRGRPDLPPLPGFEAHFGGNETQMSLVNGRFSQRVIYRWMLVPKTTGRLTIGPIVIGEGDSALRTDPIVVTVLPASERPRSERPVFVTASVSERRPFAGQQVLYVWRFYRRVRVAEPRLESLDLGGFLVEDLGDVRTFRTTEGGVEYEVSEIRKALFAQRPGTVVIPPSRLVVQLVQPQRRGGVDPFGGRPSPFDEFFGRVRTQAMNLETEPIEVQVRALPSPPADFSGLVGEFTVRSTLSGRSVPVGESVTQKVVVSGAGNLHLMGDLPLDEVDGFKVYRDQPKVELSRDGSRLQGSKSWSRALVPLRPGALEVPAVPLVYFDPGTERYLTASTPAVEIDVTPGAGGEDLRLTESLSPSTGKVAVRILAEDLLPIARGRELVARSPATIAVPLLMVAPPLAFVLLWLGRRRADRHASDVGLRRRRGALRRALQAVGAGAELSPRDASAAVRGYVGDRVGVEGLALTPRECAERLAARGAEDHLCAETRSLLERLEAADLGGSGGEPVAAAEVRTLLERLERGLKGAR